MSEPLSMDDDVQDQFETSSITFFRLYSIPSVLDSPGCDMIRRKDSCLAAWRSRDIKCATNLGEGACLESIHDRLGDQCNRATSCMRFAQEQSRTRLW